MRQYEGCVEDLSMFFAVTDDSSGVAREVWVGGGWLCGWLCGDGCWREFIGFYKGGVVRG